MLKSAAILLAMLAAFAAGIYFSPDLNFRFQTDHFASRAKTLLEVRKYGLPLNNPDAVPAAEARHMKDDDIIFGLTFNGRTRAYPRWILVGYHIVNDTIGGLPLMVAQCEICSAASAYVPTLDVPPYGPMVFSTCGFSMGTFEMCDDITGSRWHPFLGEGQSGLLAGKKLEKRIPVYAQTWGSWKKQHPGTDVVLASADVRGREHSHGPKFNMGTPYVPDYMEETANIFDTRLLPNDLVYGFKANGKSLAFPLNAFPEGVSLREVELGGARWILLRFEQFGVNAFRVDADGSYKLLSTEPLTITDGRGGKWNQFGSPLPDSTSKTPLVLADGYFAEWYEWITAHPRSELSKF